jgi:hypothetical protein
MGIEPTYQFLAGTLDLKNKNAKLLKPLIFGLISRNALMQWAFQLSIYLSLFYLFQFFSVCFVTILSH